MKACEMTPTGKEHFKQGSENVRKQECMLFCSFLSKRWECREAGPLQSLLCGLQYCIPHTIGSGSQCHAGLVSMENSVTTIGFTSLKTQLERRIHVGSFKPLHITHSKQPVRLQEIPPYRNPLWGHLTLF